MHVLFATGPWHGMIVCVCARVCSAEELERSQRLMKTAEQSLSETHKTVIQAVAPIQASGTHTHTRPHTHTHTHASSFLRTKPPV